MNLQYIPVDLSKHLETCIQFRKDAYNASYHSTDHFSEEQTIKWYNHLASKNPSGFLHIYYKQEIIGQVEFNVVSENSDNGYINLLYLIEKYRGLGLGKKIHDHTLEQLTKQGCEGVKLRYIIGNVIAEKFYLKNGWQKSGNVDVKQRQLMYKKLTS